jgi:hypothetical protein
MFFRYNRDSKGYSFTESPEPVPGFSSTKGEAVRQWLSLYDDQIQSLEESLKELTDRLSVLREYTAPARRVLTVVNQRKYEQIDRANFIPIYSMLQKRGLLVSETSGQFTGGIVVKTYKLKDLEYVVTVDESKSGIVVLDIRVYRD